MISWRRQGKSIPGADSQVVITGNRLTFRSATHTSEDLLIRMTLNKKPRWLDLVTASDPNERYLGIYGLRGSTLTVCFGLLGASRPRTFAEDTEGWSLILKRVSPR